MRVAALYDIHANLPALEAVFEGVRAAAVDLVVIGGDVLPGPMPHETLARILNYVLGSADTVTDASATGRGHGLGCIGIC